ncbi:hypothetical protein [Streptomyces sp. NPDC046759]|uniref:hypothetical protein n=1 Tax=Streptomyces sp. NPDC046759 TaxID=3155019 RepID=UPI0033E137B8
MSERKSSPEQEERGTGSADLMSSKLINIVIGQASFIAALMFYLGVIYMNHYFSYYHLNPFDLGFGFAEFALQSLNLITFPVLVSTVILIVAVTLYRRQSRQALPEALVRCHMFLVAAGLILLVLWWLWRLLLPDWAGPLLIGVGLLLGAAPHDGVDHPRGVWTTALQIFGAGLFLFWALTLVVGHLGEQHARNDARTTSPGSTGLIIYSAKPLNFPPTQGQLLTKDLGNTIRMRYRYTGLRLITVRDGRYYAVPIGWQEKTDPVYILRESDDVRFELTPGA